ncbi:MAG TPA: hypothetical protein VM911_08525 [Pyrinomonadaceae bacterium]|jgi:hypothetical protein|nr:hypothetical protein [Pyrinomonadaceae bacterium]
MRILIRRGSGDDEPPLNNIQRAELRLTKEEFLWPDKAGASEDAIARWHEEGTGHLDDTDGDGEPFCYRERSVQLTAWFIDAEDIGALFSIARFFGPLTLEDTDYLEAPLQATLQNW